MGDDSVQVRVTRSFGLVCSVNIGLGDPRLTVKTVGEPFVPNDYIFVLAANNPTLSSDDVWKLAIVRAVISTTTCNGSDTAQVLTIDGTTVGAPPDSISVGAPMRSFLHYTYGLFLIDGQAFLARELVGSATPAPMVGPLRRIVGEPTFTYWDASGTVEIVPSQVATIRLVLRTGAQIPGGVIEDSLILDTSPRNRGGGAYGSAQGSSIMTIGRTSRGYALPTVVLAVVILEVLITGAIYMAQQEYRVGWSADQSLVAFNMTERGVAEVLTNWDAARYNGLPAWGSADTTGAFADGTWSATITKMTNSFYYVDVTGVVSRGGPLRAGVSGLPILHTCGHRKLHTWRFDLAGGRVGM